MVLVQVLTWYLNFSVLTCSLICDVISSDSENEDKTLHPDRLYAPIHQRIQRTILRNSAGYQFTVLNEQGMVALFLMND